MAGSIATGRRRHLLTLGALEDGELRHLVCRSCEYAAGAGGRPLAGLVVGVYFRVTSTRTRTAFSSGTVRLGGSVIAFGPNDLQINTGETVGDTGRVLSGMLDGLVARTAGDPSELRVLAAQERMAVINAMSADEHPTQALADLATIMQRFGEIDGRRVLYVGEGNNTAAALALAVARIPRTRLWLRTPAGYGLAGDKLAEAAAIAARHGARVEERHDLRDLPAAVDVVYTTRWQTTGTSKPDPGWRTAFAPFQVDGELMARWPYAVFMHDLPAHRSEEVTAEVLDGPASLAFEQAENKLYSAMAVLEWCLAPW